MSFIEFNRKTMLLGLPYCKQKENEGIAPFTLVDFKKLKGIFKGNEYTLNRTGEKIKVYSLEYGVNTNEHNVIKIYHRKMLRKGYYLDINEYSGGGWRITKHTPDGTLLMQESFDKDKQQYYSAIETRPKDKNKRKYLDHWLLETMTLKEGESEPVVQEIYKVSIDKALKNTNLVIDINSRLYSCEYCQPGTREEIISQLVAMSKDDLPEWKKLKIHAVIATLVGFDEDAFVANMKAG